MNHSIYTQQKNDLKTLALRNKYINDKPMQRMILNDELDYIFKSGVFDNENHSPKRIEMYFNWLSNYVCTLHP